MTAQEICEALPKQIGFVIERDLPKNFSVYSKVRVAFNPQEAAATKAPAVAETTEATAEAGGEKSK